jgi:hypothetical protein
MGYLLRRMIRDGAPAGWSPLMRLVAMEIADDARDPHDGMAPRHGWTHADNRYSEAGIQLLEDAGEVALSFMPVEGRLGRDGQWRDGLTERCGVSARRISAALTDLARAGYEMRSSYGTDSRGRPVFAHKGRSMTFHVPALFPRPAPESTSDPATFRPQRSPESVLKVVRSDVPLTSRSPHEDLSPHDANTALDLTDVEGASAGSGQERFISDEEWEERERIAARVLGPLPEAVP